MKKIIAFLLALVMLLGTVGCSKNPETSDPANADSDISLDSDDGVSTDDSSDEPSQDSEDPDNNDSQDPDEQVSKTDDSKSDSSKNKAEQTTKSNNSNSSSSKDKAEQTTKSGNSNSSVTQTTKPNNSNSSSSTSKSKADEFYKWTDVDMVNYLKKEGVFSKQNWIYTQNEGTGAPLGVTKVISYMDDDMIDAYIMIFWLDPNSKTKRTEEIYNEIKTTHSYIMTEAGKFPQPFNTMIGRFAVFYTWSLDDKLVNKMTAALEKLEKTYGVKRDFINMNIDEDDYADYED